MVRRCHRKHAHDKVHQFELVTAIRSANIDFRALFEEDPSSQDTPSQDTASDDSDSEIDIPTFSTTSALLKFISLPSLSARSRLVDYFDAAAQLRRASHISIPCPFRTHQSSKNVVFHLSRDPSFKQMTVEDAAAMFDLPDFRPALGDYMIRLAGQNGEPFIKTVGGRRYSHQGCQLPFTHIEVWNWV
jgi:hypothetical protein